MEQKNNQFHQGEPINALLFLYEDDDTPISSFVGLVLEFVMYDSVRRVVQSWSTSGGNVTIGQITESGVTSGYASISMTGAKTATLEPDRYTIELANVVSPLGRKIGTVKQCIEIIPAVLKNGIIS